jgi:predicted O-methyltransferase YrrM
MNEILTEMLQTRKAHAPNGHEHKIHIFNRPEQGELLLSLIRRLKPRVTLEVGLAHGISALQICEALAEVGGKKHYVIDPNQSSEWKNIGLESLRRAGYTALVELREKMSHVALPELLSEGVELDFAYIDGWHVFDQVLLDFFFIDKMLKVGAVVAFDDASWPSVRKVLRYVVTNRRYSVVECLAAPRSRKDKLAQLLRPLTRGLPGRLLKPEIVHPDGALGLVRWSDCIALRKEAQDARAISDHWPF